MLWSLGNRKMSGFYVVKNVFSAQSGMMILQEKGVMSFCYSKIREL